MTDSVPSFLTEWGAFYTMAGSAAAALTGLMFVVITLITGGARVISSSNAISAFSTPTVLHFSVALLVSAILLAPWHVPLYASVLVTLVGVYGLVHIARVIVKARRLDTYQPDLEDWTWFTVLPIVGYGAICGGGLFLFGDPKQALFAIATGTLVLMFVGIRNSWDVVTYIALQRAEEEQPAPAPDDAPSTDAPAASDEPKPVEPSEAAPT